jgi:hypothetical protein
VPKLRQSQSAISAEAATILADPNLFPVKDLPSRLPVVCGRRITRCTARRWAKVGVRGVVLASARLGWERVTTQAAVDEFLAKLAST